MDAAAARMYRDFPGIDPMADGTWRLRADWWAELPDGRYLFLPQGHRTNFGSIPWFVRWLISPVDVHLAVPAIIHDFLVGEYPNFRARRVPVIYRSKNPANIDDHEIDWPQASAILRWLMDALGAPDWKRFVVYWGTRLHGKLRRKPGERWVDENVAECLVEVGAALLVLTLGVALSRLAGIA